MSNADCRPAVRAVAVGAPGQTGAPRVARPRSVASPAQVLAIVCVGICLANLDLFIVNVGLPAIGRDFAGSTLADTSWILNGYAIAYAALLVFFGRLAERYRRNASFLLGVALFTLASAACAAADSVAVLVVFRLAQAAGAALMTPTSIGLLLAVYPPERCGPGRRSAASPRRSARLSAACCSWRAGAGSSWSTFPSVSLRWLSAGIGCPMSRATIRRRRIRGTPAS